MEQYPLIIQGGMGVNISGYRLARTVSMLNQLGTVSGVMAEITLANSLQLGDPTGDYRRALDSFPFPHIAKSVKERYFVEGGIPNGTRFKTVPIFSINPPDELITLSICANYALVWLSKEGHSNLVSINYLEKVAMPHIYAITGAMLAGVDFITMGAGIPLHIPAVINNIYEGETASYPITVYKEDGTSWLWEMKFNPKEFFGEKLPIMKKPGFIPIISSNMLASFLVDKLPKGSIFGFIVEEPSAGGHNAPPRKKVVDEKTGEPLPIYGPKDAVDYKKLAELGVPFWIGGAKASPEYLKWALSVGAQGIQVGSIFGLCEESGMEIELRKYVRTLGFYDFLSVKTNMRVSPTGFPFKVAQVFNTLSDESTYSSRIRKCDKGGLLSAHERSDGFIGYRCPAENALSFVKKGGKAEETVGRCCLCNGLFTACGLGNPGEPPIVTLGDDLSFLQNLMADGCSSYAAEDAIRYLLSSL